MGTLTAADTVTTGAHDAEKFHNDQPVRITAAANKKFDTTVKLITAAANTIQLTAAPPAADFPGNVAVQVVALKGFKTMEGDAGPAPAVGADQTIDVASDDLTAPGGDQPLLVRPSTGGRSSGAAHRQGQSRHHCAGGQPAHEQQQPRDPEAFA